MLDGKRLEDNISMEDLLQKPEKDLLVMIYIQALKTNGTVAENCKDISVLNTEIKDKIGMKLFAWLSGAVAFLIVLFNVLDRIMG
jgi:hypothetical protein